jgi:hypothetical protein
METVFVIIRVIRGREFRHELHELPRICAWNLPDNVSFKAYSISAALVLHLAAIKRVYASCKLNWISRNSRFMETPGENVPIL